MFSRYVVIPPQFVVMTPKEFAQSERLVRINHSQLFST
jgi:hypothetical protein